MADPWAITQTERVKHEEQFIAVRPVGNVISGEQAKGFFLQSRLPPRILGVIWMLADMDGDGKMNLTEFSVACKLINMKLRGFNLPQVLPAIIKQTACGAQNNFPVTAGTQPQMAMQMGPIAPPPMPVGMQPAQMAMVNQQLSGMGGPQVAAVPIDQRGYAAPAPIIPQQIAYQSPPTVTSPPLGKGTPMQAVVPPAQVDAQRRLSHDSGGIHTPTEWAIPQASKLKFTQVFNMSDRTKSGYLSGVQSRNILIQSQLPQNALAQIWALSDVDNDGRLSCEEFVLALYLCEQAKAGHNIPTVLAADLIPPSLRKGRRLSIQSVGSVGTPVEGTINSVPHLMSESSFEDKRKENYEKGQAELDRRRKTLLDAQRREAEERMRREREEETKREKARQEAERKKQEELEIEMHRRREIESQKEEERKRQEDMKERARHEAERQRQNEWENQRLQELMNVRQKQQESLLALKAKNQTLGIDLSTKEQIVKDLTQQISTTRTGVTEVKATIDGMRSTRDTHMSNMNALKAQARDQNQRLLSLNQEKAKLKARSLAAGGAEGAESAAIEASVVSKRLVISQLEEKLKAMEKEFSEKEQDTNNNITEFDSMKEQLLMTADRCKELYAEFTDKKQQVMILREKLVNPDAAWGDTGGAWSETTAQEPEPVVTGVTGSQFKALYEFEARNHDELSFYPGDIITVTAAAGAEEGWLSGEVNGNAGWFPEAYCQPYEAGMEEEVLAGEPMATQELTNGVQAVGITSKPVTAVYGEAIAVFSFEAKQNNQISLSKKDVITVKENFGEWGYGEISGRFGWFPLSYVVVKASTSPVTTPTSRPDLPEIPVELSHEQFSQYYVAAYPYVSDEPDDLQLQPDEVVLVVKKDGDWWNGIVGERTGIFPSNYVQEYTPQVREITPATVDIRDKQEEQFVYKKQDTVETQPYVTSDAVPTEQVKQTVVTPESAKIRMNVDDGDTSINKEIAELTKFPKSPKGGKRKPDVAQVIAPYDATGSNQLSLVRGQLVMIRKKTSSGWWEGELQAKGKQKQIGWFPASYVKVMVGSARTTPVSMEMMGEGDMPLDIPAAAFSADFKKYESKIVENSPQIIVEKVTALYPYVAANDDELTFNAGDVMIVLDKEDSAWWKGDLKGTVGVFPSNYVQPVGSAGVTVASPEGGLEEDSLCSKSSAGSMRSMEKKRRNVIEEIIVTEKSYLQDLLLVKQAFIIPMRKSGIVTQMDLSLIFANWDELIKVSSIFNKALKVRSKNSPDGRINMLSDILCEQMAQMTPYVRFCSLQIKGSAILNEKFTEGGAFTEVVKQCQENPAVGGRKLTFYLLKPMQRITRYPLLIKQLLAYTNDSHSDFYNTLEAHNAAQTLCEQVNEAVGQRDNTDKLEWMQNKINCKDLQERLIFNSLTNFLGPRKVLHMGILVKTKSKKEILAFLLSDFLLLTTPNRSIGNAATSLAAFDRILSNVHCELYRKPMFLDDLVLEVDPSSDTAFAFGYPNSQEVNVTAPTSHERSNWLKKIAIAKKHIEDTKRSLNNRKQSKEKSSQYLGRLRVEVASGSELKSKDSGLLHSFCEVSLGSQSKQTSVATSANPRWDSTMQFLVKSFSEDVLCITVYEKGYFRPNEFLGRVEMQVQSIHEDSAGVRVPLVYKLNLEEVNRGEVILKASLHIFE